MTDAVSLTQRDIDMLAAERSPQARQLLAEKIASHYNDGRFNPVETVVAQEIFRLLMRDELLAIRLILSDMLKENPNVPLDIIVHLARDEVPVAVPVLQFSYVLHEEDLEALAREAHDVGKLMAIARRETLSSPVSAVLIEKSEPRVTQTLLNNGGASIDERDLLPAIDRIQGQDALLEAILARKGFSLSVQQRAFSNVSEQARSEIAVKYQLNDELAQAVGSGIREMVNLGLVPPGIRPSSVSALVHDLFQQKRLTISLMLRALCMGQLAFFEHAMANMAHVPLINAQLLMANPREKGFNALYKASHLPPEYFGMVQHLLVIVNEVSNYGKLPRDRFLQPMLERLQLAPEEPVAEEQMEFVNAIINQAMTDARATA